MRILPPLLLAALAACQTSYRTPGAAADLSLFTDARVDALLRREPAAAFPARLAVCRVQGPGYESCTARGWGGGGYSVVPVRDVEEDAHFDRIARLPRVSGVALVNKLLLPAHLGDDRDMRRAAAALGADVLLVYTLDTAFHVDRRLKPATLLSLGLFPNRRAHVACTASGVFLDTRTGYVFATVAASGREDKLANAWSTEQAVDDSRRKAECAAFAALVAQMEREWPRAVAAEALRTSGGARYETVTR